MLSLTRAAKSGVFVLGREGLCMSFDLLTFSTFTFHFAAVDFGLVSVLVMVVDLSRKDNKIDSLSAKGGEKTIMLLVKMLEREFAGFLQLLLVANVSSRC